MRFPLALLLIAGCGDDSSSSAQPAPRPPLEVAKQPLSMDAMRAMMVAGQPCIGQFRARMPGSYSVKVWATRTNEGQLALEFRSGDRSEFNACIVKAIREARIPVQLENPVEVPLVFDFSAT